jgi:CRP-like cAMP-binding protein
LPADASLAELQRSRFFAGAAPEQVLAFVAAATHLSFEPGDVLIHEGVVDSGMYLLLRGAIEFSRAVGDGKRTITTFSTDNSGVVPFAALGLLGDLPRTATVVALKQTRVLRVDPAEFARLAERDPGLGYLLTRRVAGNLLDDYVKTLQRVRELERTTADIPTI